MPTDTEIKLTDAATQMKMALDNIENEDIFRSCVNSFISNARSVTMLMEKESSKNNDIKNWYKTKMEIMGEFPLFKYFNKQRVHTIHKGVVKPVKKGHKSSDFTIYFDTKTEKHSAEVSIPPQPEGIHIGEKDIIRITEDGIIWGWYFTDIASHLPNESGNVPDLCERYFIELKNLVIEWLKLKS